MVLDCLRVVVDVFEVVVDGFRGKWMFCSILVFHVRDMLSSRFISDNYTLF